MLDMLVGKLAKQTVTRCSQHFRVAASFHRCLEYIRAKDIGRVDHALVNRLESCSSVRVCNASHSTQT